MKPKNQMIKTKDIHDISRYIGLSLLSKGATISPFKLQELLYYLQAWTMVYFGRENTVFEEVPQAGVNGPVYPTIYQEYEGKTNDYWENLSTKDFGTDERNILIELSNLSKKMDLSDDVIEFFDSVITLYGTKEEIQLAFLTHAEYPWSKTREGLAPFEDSQREIPLDLIYEYFLGRHKKVIKGKRTED
jgi:uncharacterized phage-associated protein